MSLSFCPRADLTIVVLLRARLSCSALVQTSLSLCSHTHVFSALLSCRPHYRCALTRMSLSFCPRADLAIVVLPHACLSLALQSCRPRCRCALTHMPLSACPRADLAIIVVLSRACLSRSASVQPSLSICSHAHVSLVLPACRPCYRCALTRMSLSSCPRADPAIVVLSHTCLSRPALVQTSLSSLYSHAHVSFVLPPCRPRHRYALTHMSLSFCPRADLAITVLSRACLSCSALVQTSLSI